MLWDLFSFFVSLQGYLPSLYSYAPIYMVVAFLKTAAEMKT